jgi:hypothetical protein
MTEIERLIQDSAVKVIADESLTHTRNAPFPKTVPTHRLTGRILQCIYERMVIDGAGSDPYLTMEGRPFFAAIMSRQMFKSVNWDDSYKELIHDYPKPVFGARALFAKEEPINPFVSYDGFVIFTVGAMPRNDFVNGEWAERTASRNATQEEESKQANATCEDVLLWHRAQHILGTALRVRRVATSGIL